MKGSIRSSDYLGPFRVQARIVSGVRDRVEVRVGARIRVRITVTVMVWICHEQL